MKKIYTALLLLIGTTLSAQTIIFDDPVFKARLLASGAFDQVAQGQSGVYLVLDSSGDGELQVSEVQNVYTLNLNNSNLTSLGGLQHFTNLRTLNCTGNRLTALNVSALTNLETVRLTGNQIATLDLSMHPNMKNIWADNNALTTLNLNGLMNLNALKCNNNQLTSLQVANWAQMGIFDCSFNSITSLTVNNAANYISTFNCNDNQLQSLQFTGTNNFMTLKAGNNQLTSIDLSTLTDYIMDVDLGHNQLTSIVYPPLGSVSGINLSYNNLNSFNLNAISTSSMNFHIELGHNQIATADFSLQVGSGFSIGYLALNDNPLQHLNVDAIGTSLDDNFEVSIDKMIDDIHITGNLRSFNLINEPSAYVNFENISASQIQIVAAPNLKRINLKNGVTNSLWVYDNAPMLEYVCADEDELLGVRQYLTSIGHPDMPLNSYCSFTPGGDFYVIEGDTRFNPNGNCQPNNPVYPNLRFNITDGTTNGSIIANQTGHYSIPVQTGSHTITPVLENPMYFAISPTSATINLPGDATPSINNFCMTPVGYHPDLEVVIIPVGGVGPGFEAHYKLIYTNKGNTIESGNIEFQFGNTVSFVSATQTVISQTANSLLFSFTDLQLFESREIYIIMLANTPTAEPPLNGGDIVHYEAMIDTGHIEASHAVLNQIAVNSFDPNDKTCLEGQTISATDIGKYVHYQIRFENTGTANAVNIVVADVIDTTKFDINSLVPIDGSHDFYTRIKGNKVEFIFENIQLPFDDANNDGYVVFKIKTKPTLVVGDSFSNAASIYFDFNHPIVTDPAVTTIAVLKNEDFVFSDEFAVYPNPANGVLHIRSKKNTILTSAEIYNAVGQLVLSTTDAGQIDLSPLASGQYFIRIHSEMGISNVRFVKQ